MNIFISKTKTEFEYEYIRFENFNQIRIRILFFSSNDQIQIRLIFVFCSEYKQVNMKIGKTAIVKSVLHFMSENCHIIYFIHTNKIWSCHQTKYLVYKKKPGKKYKRKRDKSAKCLNCIIYLSKLKNIQSSKNITRHVYWHNFFHIPFTETKLLMYQF